MFKEHFNQYHNTVKLIEKPKEDFEHAINCFLTGKTGKFNRYIAVENALVYRHIYTENGQPSVMQNIVAYRLKSGLVLGNSSILPLIGRTSSFGNPENNRSITPVQESLSQLVLMVPFTVFLEAGLDLEQFEIVERGPDETITRKIENPKYNKYKKEDMLKKGIPRYIEETVHFTGYTLFRVENQCFLFDVDRIELEHKIFNAFLVAIPKEVKTRDEAYEALKPKEVLEAEAKGLKVTRQGEWFFIPVNSKAKADKNQPRSWRSKLFTEGVLRAGRNRPNTSSFTNEAEGLVKGLVKHSGREHRTVILRSWHRAVPNTAIESFTITGDVD